MRISNCKSKVYPTYNLKRAIINELHVVCGVKRVSPETTNHTIPILVRDILTPHADQEWRVYPTAHAHCSVGCFFVSYIIMPLLVS